MLFIISAIARIYFSRILKIRAKIPLSIRKHCPKKIPDFLGTIPLCAECLRSNLTGHKQVGASSRGMECTWSDEGEIT